MIQRNLQEAPGFSEISKNLQEPQGTSRKLNNPQGSSVNIFKMLRWRKKIGKNDEKDAKNWEKGRKGQKIGKKDEKDEKGVISVPRSSVRSHATHAIGELKN